MIAVLIGAALGAALAPLLRAVATRYAVPYGEPLRECCTRGRYVRRPGGGCPRCGRAYGPGAWSVEALSTAVGGAIGWAAHWPSVLPLVWVGLFGVVLAVVDLAVYRLPDRLTLPLGLGTAALLLLTEHQLPVLLRCLYAALALGGFYGALALVAPLGLGDAKLAPTLGALLGWYGWAAVVQGTFLGFLLGGVWGVVLLLTGRARRGSELAFGPWMLLGALLAVLLAG